MKVKVFLVTIGLVSSVFVSCQHKSTGEAEIKNEADTISYYLGISIGRNLNRTPMKDVNIDALVKGMEMVLSGNDTTKDVQQITMEIGNYMRKLEYAQGQTNLKEGEAFLDRNKERKGVITTESGLQYEVLRQGTGPKPKPSDEVTVHYTGTLIDGTVFESSVDRGEPATFKVNEVISGWTEGLQLMSVGSKYKFYIPTELAYGMRPRPGSEIKPNMALIFEVELLSISDTTEQE